jgi:hypothetical protein
VVIFTGVAGTLVSGSPFSGDHRIDYNGLTDKFYSGWLGSPETWPTAPVDLRFDRQRGVWTVPSDFRILLVTPQSAIASNASEICDVHNADDVYDSGGALVSSPTVSVTNPFAEEVPTAKILVYYAHESGTYFPIHYCCGGGGSPPPPPPPPPPPCGECLSRCEYECNGTNWVLKNNNCTQEPGCDCPDALTCFPQDSCNSSTNGLLNSCACAATLCAQYSTFEQAADNTISTGIDFFSDRQVPGIKGTTVVELLYDMPCTGTYAFASGTDKVFDDQPYSGIVSGTAIDYSAVICIGTQTGQDPLCEFTDTNPYICTVNNFNGKYNLPAGTTATVKQRYGTNTFEIMEYELPNKGCLEVSASTGLNYYKKVFVDASAGDVVLTLPLATGQCVAGSEYQVKKIDSSSNNVIVSGTGTDTIDGTDTYYMFNQYEAVKFVACGNDQWFVF